MDKIDKFIRSLTIKDRAMLKNIISDIAVLNTDKYDLKPLKGYKDIYRIRKGKIRIIFYKSCDTGILIDISYRKDAYKNI